MAVTVVYTHLHDREIAVITFTGDGDGLVRVPDKRISALSITSDGVDGGGTLTWFGSGDGATFSALGLNTVADPRNATAITSTTALGNWIASRDLLALSTLKFTLASSTTPTLVVTVNMLH